MGAEIGLVATNGYEGTTEQNTKGWGGGIKYRKFNKSRSGRSISLRIG